MSWKNFAPMGNETRRLYGRNKMCCCGGHSQNDHKKNLWHSGTARRLAIRQNRHVRSLEKRAWIDQDALL